MIHKQTEKLKLWLKDNSREFGVFVEIKYTTKTEEAVKITLREIPK
ncbi:DUF3889 domain-containing protein [Pseudobacillus sp. FSL P4-0506]